MRLLELYLQNQWLFKMKVPSLLWLSISHKGKLCGNITQNVNSNMEARCKYDFQSAIQASTFKVVHKTMNK
jgi:hypothetical protein